MMGFLQRQNNQLQVEVNELRRRKEGRPANQMMFPDDLSRIPSEPRMVQSEYLDETFEDRKLEED